VAFRNLRERGPWHSEEAEKRRIGSPNFTSAHNADLYNRYFEATLPHD